MRRVRISREVFVLFISLMLVPYVGQSELQLRAMNNLIELMAHVPLVHHLCAAIINLTSREHVRTFRLDR
jgi:hypothetical protein